MVSHIINALRARLGAYSTTTVLIAVAVVAALGIMGMGTS